jgi:hypothetical protein
MAGFLADVLSVEILVQSTIIAVVNILVNQKLAGVENNSLHSRKTKDEQAGDL